MALLCLFVGPARCTNADSGLASHYSDDGGRHTASGARFDDRLAEFAAHRCLPFGTMRVSHGAVR